MSNRIDYDVAIEIASHEAIVRQAYKDSVGVWTWSVGLTSGSGHDVTRYIGKPQSLEHCLAVYAWALETYAKAVRTAFAGHTLTKSQFAAALSFHWNTGAIGRAEWVKLWKAGDIAGARAAFMNWRKPPEIIGRRTKERDLFFDGRWSNDGTMTEFTRLTSNSTPDWSSGKRINVARELKSALGGGGGTPEPLVVGSDEIRAWQRQLASLGFAVGPIDGIAGDKTVAAVKAFQLRQGLTVDGVVGPETRAALDAAVTQPKPDGPGPGAGSSVGFSWRAVVVGAVFIVIVAAIIVFAA